MSAETKKTKRAHKSKFARISSLSAEHKAILHGKLADEMASAAIARFFRDKLGLWQEVKFQSSEKMITEYRKDPKVKPLVLSYVGNFDENNKIALTKENIQPLQEMSELIVAQKIRVQKLLTQEVKMPALFNSLGNEMKTLAGFVVTYADLAFETGVMRRASTTTTISSGGVDTVIESDGREQIQFSLEAHDKLEKAASAFFQIIEGTFSEVAKEEEHNESATSN